MKEEGLDRKSFNTWYLIFKKKGYMQDMVATTVSIIHGEPLSKIVDSIIVNTICSWYLKNIVSEPIDIKVDRLLDIITTQCKMLNNLKADMKIVKANSRKLLAHHTGRKEEERRSWQSSWSSRENIPSLQNLSYLSMFDHVPSYLIVKNIVNSHNFL